MLYFLEMIVINPDIHGRTFWKESKDLPADKIIFLGDYLDPYFFECILKEDALKNFKEILEFKKANKDKVILLLGNHCEEYLDTFICECRCDYDNYDEIRKLFVDNAELFDIFYKYENKGKSFLFSHAGIADNWLGTFFENDLNKLENLFLKNRQNNFDLDDDFLDSMAAVSHYRGGEYPVGSIVWRDIIESISNKYGYQIFGHTMLSQPIVTDKYACLDCKRSFILNDENEICELNGNKVEIY